MYKIPQAATRFFAKPKVREAMEGAIKTGLTLGIEFSKGYFYKKGELAAEKECKAYSSEPEKKQPTTPKAN